MNIRLFLRKKFTKEQQCKVDESPCISQLFYGIKLFYKFEIIEKLPPEIAETCVDILIKDQYKPDFTAIIICRLFEIGALSRIEQAQDYLKKIDAWECDYKEGLASALDLIYSMFNSSELANAYTNDILNFKNIFYSFNEAQLSSNSLKAYLRVDEIRFYLKNLSITDNLSLINSFNKFYSLLGGTEYFFELVGKLYEHKNINGLNNALEIISINPRIYKPSSKITYFCLNAIIRDQQTPEATANILNYIFCYGIFPSTDLVKVYCDKVSYLSLTKKIYVNFLADKLVFGNNMWPSAHIARSIITMLDDEEPLDEVDYYINQFITSINNIELIFNEELYKQLEPLTNPSTARAFVRVVGIFYGTLQGFKDFNFKFMPILERLENSLSQFLSRASIRSLIPSLSNIRKYFISNTCDNNSLKSKVIESCGYSQYCSYMLKTSNRFFSHPKVPILIEEPQEISLANVVS